jgi:hypothetical protein
MDTFTYTEISKICGVGARRFEDPDLRTSLFEHSAGRMEGHILIRSHSDVQSDLEGDILVGILLSFMMGNSVPRGPGVDYRWCPLTQKIGLTSCEWSLNNPKDPTLHRMIKVLSRMTKGSDLTGIGGLQGTNGRSRTGTS